MSAKKNTHGEQGAGRCAAAIANDSNLLGVEQCLGRGVNSERLALLAQFLTEEIITAVDNLLDRVLKPIIFCREEGIVCESPVKGVIQQISIRIRSISNGGRDSLGERLSTGLSVETGLGFRGVLGSGDDAVKPLGNTNIPTAIVGDVDYELFGTGCLEVL